MKPQTGFPNIRRMIGLSRILLHDDWRPFLLNGFIVGALVFLGRFFVNLHSINTLLNIMLLIGIVLVSKTFSDLHEKEKGTYMLMLPASIEEKYLVRLISTLVLFYIFALFVTFAADFLSGLIVGLLTGSARYAFFDLHTSDLAGKFQVYLFFHAIFFSGSLFFRKNSFLKTTLCLIGALLVGFIALGSYFRHQFFGRQQVEFYFQFDSSRDLFGNLQLPFQDTIFFIKTFVLIGIPILLYLLSYFRFKHSEIRG